MGSVATVIGLAILIIVLWLALSALVRRIRRAAQGLEAAVEDARAMAVDIDWDMLGMEKLDRNRAFRRHVERLSQPDVPFAEVVQMARSATPGVAALGLSAIARRDDVPADWATDAIRLLTSCASMVEPFVYPRAA